MMNEQDIKFIEGLHAKVDRLEKENEDLKYTIDLWIARYHDLEVENKRLRTDREYSA